MFRESWGSDAANQVTRKPSKAEQWLLFAQQLQNCVKLSGGTLQIFTTLDHKGRETVKYVIEVERIRSEN